MLKIKIFIYFLLLTLLTACIKNNEYGGSIGTSEIKEAQTTNEVALTNLNLGIAYLTENNYDKALEKLNKSLGLQNTKITLDLAKRVYMDGRKNLIKRCLNNLIDNGIKYAENIHIHLIKSQNHIIITIDDDGPGIQKKDYDNVFKPFFKVDKSRGGSKSSVGLGLSIASDVIKSHGGNINLDKSPQKGLRVKIFFPF